MAVKAKTFVKAASKAVFEAAVGTGKDFSDSIVFIVAEGLIWAKGQYYSTSVADKNRIETLEEAVDALEKGKYLLEEKEKVLDIVQGTGDDEGKSFLKTVLSLDYGKRTVGADEVDGQGQPVVDNSNYIFIRGKENVEVARLNVDALVKDKFVESAKLFTEAEAGVKDCPDAPYIRLTFANSDDTIRFSVKDLMDIYDASNLELTSAFEVPEKYTKENIKSGANLNTVIGELVVGIDEAMNSGVLSIGGVSGDITLKGDNVADGSINLSISEGGELTAEILNLGSAAFTDAGSYATAKQGGYADSALQGIYPDTDNADPYITLSIGEKDGDYGNKSQVLSVSANVCALDDATEENDGLASAYEVKKVLSWEEIEAPKPEPEPEP